MVYITQILLAFIEGIGLIISPCILPILPIMLAASLDGGKARPLGIITGFISAFTAFALASRQIIAALDIDPEIIRNVSLDLIALFGVVMLSKTLSDKLLGTTQGLANFGQNLSMRVGQKDGFFSGLSIGALIGLIWTPCAGPILAAVVVQIIQAKTSFEAALTVGMFALGAGLPMLAIALMGRQVMSRLTFLKTHSYAVRRVLGVIIIGMAVLIYLGLDVKLLALSGETAQVIRFDGKLHNALDKTYPAPEIAGVMDWINSPPLTIESQRGKVVLVDFWTYSCINCLRTLPYLTKWDEKYRKKGLVIIGVHSPEFDFEKKISNVREAVTKFGIQYPVALDSTFATWSNFSNKFWPAHYLINKEGQVVYTHYGEGNYDVTENNIRVLLDLGPEEGDEIVKTAPTFSPLQTPETYLGYARIKNFVSKIGVPQDVTATYEYPASLVINNWALEGDWRMGPENITTQKEGAALRINFIARKVFLVMGTRDGNPINVQVMLNGRPLEKTGGADVKDSVVIVDHETLYELIDQGEFKNGILELRADQPGLQAYAFTFGQ